MLKIASCLLLFLSFADAIFGSYDVSPYARTVRWRTLLLLNWYIEICGLIKLGGFLHRLHFPYQLMAPLIFCIMLRFIGSV